MRDKALHVIKTLQSSNHRAVAAGGVARDKCIRDLLGVEVETHDWDIATSATPEQIKAVFPHTLTVGEKFGVTIVVIDGAPIEVATFRKDGKYTDGRRPDTVELTNILEEDASRRDFTINAMFYDPTEDVIIDFFQGETDIKNKVIRAVGDPHTRMREDWLRMMRAVRFHAKLGFSLDPALKEAIKHYDYNIGHIAKERVRDELIKICGAAYPASGFELLHELHLLGRILPEVSSTVACEQDLVYHPEGDVWTHTLGVVSTLKQLGADPLLIFAGLLHDIGKVRCKQSYEDKEGRKRISNNGHDHEGGEMALRICNRLRMPTATCNKVRLLVKNHMKAHVAKEMNQSTLIRFLRALSNEDILESQILLQHADALNSGRGEEKSLFQFYKDSLGLLQPTIEAKCIINGDDLIEEFNLKPGPQFKIILEKVSISQDEGLINSREEALDFVRKELSLGGTLA